MAVQNRRRVANAERLRELQLSHGDEITIFCAHDASEYAALAGEEWWSLGDSNP